MILQKIEICPGFLYWHRTPLCAFGESPLEAGTVAKWKSREISVHRPAYRKNGCY